MLRQRLAEADRPELRLPGAIRPPDQDRVGAGGPADGGHGRTAAQEVDLDQVDRAREEHASLGRGIAPGLDPGCLLAGLSSSIAVIEPAVAAVADRHEAQPFLDPPRGTRPSRCLQQPHGRRR